MWKAVTAHCEEVTKETISFVRSGKCAARARDKRPDDADARCSAQDATHGGALCQEFVEKTSFSSLRQDGAFLLGCKPTGRVGGVWSFVNTRDTCLDYFKNSALTFCW